MRRGQGVRVFLYAAAVMVAGCSTNILHGIDERSANEATAALERAGIGAEKLPDEGAPAGGGATYTIRVAHADGTRAVDLLRALGLPHDRRRGFSETYGQPSLIPTPSEERARYVDRSEEHTSELQSLRHLVCRLLLEKNNNQKHEDENRRSPN